MKKLCYNFTTTIDWKHVVTSDIVHIKPKHPDTIMNRFHQDNDIVLIGHTVLPSWGVRASIIGHPFDKIYQMTFWP